jgi:hypothetical protein
LEVLGDDALGLLDALDIEKVHFVGLSMGGTCIPGRKDHIQIVCGYRKVKSLLI